MSLEAALAALGDRRDLSEEEAHHAMTEVMSGRARPEAIVEFLKRLRDKGETINEITGFARAMRDASVRIQPRVAGRIIDTCSTGGAPVKTFNLGTTAAFVAAAAGAPVAKHGNRSFTRPCGSADLIEALGANLNVLPERVRAILEDVGVAFLFAPSFHPAMKHAAGPRKTLGGRTVFNILGPLTNPAGAKGQVLGVFDSALAKPLAHVLQRLGLEHALVLHADGSDEPTLHGLTRIWEVRDGSVRHREIRATDLGLPDLPPDRYGTLPPPEAAREARRILGGGEGPRAEALKLNAGLALYVAGRAPTLEKGVERAAEILASRRSLDKVDAFVEATQRPGVVAE